MSTPRRHIGRPPSVGARDYLSSPPIRLTRLHGALASPSPRRLPERPVCRWREGRVPEAGTDSQLPWELTKLHAALDEQRRQPTAAGLVEARDQTHPDSRTGQVPLELMSTERSSGSTSADWRRLAAVRRTDHPMVERSRKRMCGGSPTLGPSASQILSIITRFAPDAGRPRTDSTTPRHRKVPGSRRFLSDVDLDAHRIGDPGGDVERAPFGGVYDAEPAPRPVQVLCRDGSTPGTNASRL